VRGLSQRPSRKRKTRLLAASRGRARMTAADATPAAATTDGEVIAHKTSTGISA